MSYRVSNHKYKAIPTEVDGIVFPSKKQAVRYQELKILERTRLISDLQLEVWFDITVNGMKICRYRADFSYKNKHGDTIIEDTKGVRTPEYKLKAKLMLAVHGIRVVET